MENKVKLQAAYTPECEVIDICGQEIKVLKSIRYEDKVSYAQEYAAMACVIDEKQEIAYEAYDVMAAEIYLLCKYYTNIDTKEYDLRLEDFYDMIRPYQSRIRDACYLDFCDTEYMAARYADKTIELYNMQHALAQKLKMSFGSILTGEDLLKDVVESKTLNEGLIDLLEKARMIDEKEEANVVLFPWAGKKE